MLKKLITLGLILSLFILVLPSCKITNTTFAKTIEQAIVQIHIPMAEQGEKDITATGMVVGDGSEVLTVLDYEQISPQSVTVIVPGKGNIKGIIKKIDTRTSLTLIQLQNNIRLPVADIGDPNLLKPNQMVNVTGISLIQGKIEKFQAQVLSESLEPPLCFDIQIPQSEMGNVYLDDGAIVTDNQDKVLGLAGNSYNSLVVRWGSGLGSNPVVKIDSLHDLLSSENKPWLNGPVITEFSDANGGHGYFTGSPLSWPAVNDVSPSGDNKILSSYDDMSAALAKISHEAGVPVPQGELPITSLNQYLINPLLSDFDGNLLTAVYARPIELRDKAGVPLATAKWIGIQWNRDKGRANRILYGDINNDGATNLTTYEIKGGFYLPGDLGQLIGSVENALSVQ